MVVWSAGTGGHLARARRVAGSANPAASAGHAPARTEADYELTLNLYHSVAAYQCRYGKSPDDSTYRGL